MTKVWPDPLTAEEVMGFIKEVQATPEVWTIFERMGAYGMPDKEELGTIEAFRDDYRKRHGLEAKSLNAFFGAYALIRKVVSGAWASVDCEEAQGYLREEADKNEILDTGEHGKRPVSRKTNKKVVSSLEERMWFINEVLLRDDPWLKPLMEDLYNLPLNEPISGENVAEYFHFFRAYYQKYALVNRHEFWGAGKDMLAALRKGRVATFPSQAAWDYLDNLR